MPRRKPSLYGILGIVVSATVFVSMAAHTGISISLAYNKAFADSQTKAAETIDALKKSVGYFIKAYSPQEYEILIANEMKNADFRAILVSDLLTGHILGKDVYLTGKVLDAEGKSIDIDTLPQKEQDSLLTCDPSEKAEIASPEGDVIGHIRICISLEEAWRHAEESIVHELIQAIIVALLLTAVLVFVLRQLVIRPVLDIVRAFSQAGEVGVPAEELPVSGSRELTELAQSINSMANVVRTAQEKIRASEQRWNFALDGSRNGVWDWDAATNKVFFSLQWKQMLGYTNEEIGDDLSEWKSRVHPDDLDHCFEKLNAHLRGETPYYESEHRLRCKDGSYKWILDRGRVVERDSSGAPIRVIGTHSDITEKREREAVVRASQEQLSLALMGADLGLWDWNIATGATTFDDRWMGMLGYVRGDLAQSNEQWMELMHPDDRPRVMEALAPHLEGTADRQYEVEFRLRTKDGGWKWVLGRGAVVQWDDQGKPMRMAGTHLDIGDRKRAEFELIEARRTAEEATALKDRFVNLVAHDLRSPLALVDGTLQQLVMAEATKDPILKTLITESQERVERMANMIEELLNLSRLQSGVIKPKYELFDAFMAVEAALANMRHLASRKGVSLTNGVPKGVRIKADFHLISEVFQNLLTNAVKFTPAGGAVVVRHERAGDVDSFSVVDTGGGIPDQIVDNLFREDVKTSTPGTDGERGTGFGLPYAHAIVAAHGGDISVASTGSDGTEFRLTLPYLRPRVLVVDDEPAARMLVIAHLQKMDAVIIEAEDGQAGMELVDEQPFDLVISDINMPKMTGFEVLEQIRKNPETSDMPVIVLTSDNSVETRERILALGANDFLAKPVAKEELIPRVRRFI